MMFEAKRQRVMLSYFDEKIVQSAQRREKLLKDARKDEANLEKIKENVFGIFKTVFQSVLKYTGNGDSKEISSAFLKKMEQIPSNWRISYQKAEKHGNVEKAVIEKAKLETVEDIRTTFQSVWSDSDDRTGSSKPI